jgi:hypothetical protein
MHWVGLDLRDSELEQDRDDSVLAFVSFPFQQERWHVGEPGQRRRIIVKEISRCAVMISSSKRIFVDLPGVPFQQERDRRRFGDWLHNDTPSLQLPLCLDSQTSEDP